MVYLYSIISGFRAILGSQGIQLAMAICLTFLRAPNDAYADYSAEENAEIHS